MNGNDQLIEGYEIGMGFTYASQYMYGLPQRAMNTTYLPLG
jgi:hypothetical protein